MVTFQKSRLKFLLIRKPKYLLVKVGGFPLKTCYTFYFTNLKLYGASTHKTRIFFSRFVVAAVVVDRLVKNGVIA